MNEYSEIIVSQKDEDMADSFFGYDKKEIVCKTPYEVKKCDGSACDNCPLKGERC